LVPRATARDALATVNALVAEGLTNKEMADRLGVAASTDKDRLLRLALNKRWALRCAGAGRP